MAQSVTSATTVSASASGWRITARRELASPSAANGAKPVTLIGPLPRGRRGSGPAVAVAAEIAAAQGPDTIVVMLAADHVVQDRAGLIALCKQAAVAAAEGYIVTLGIKPTDAATGYGYIRPGAPVSDGSPVLKVESFVEKPDRDTARQYVEAGSLWDSRTFSLRRDVSHRR